MIKGLISKFYANPIFSFEQVFVVTLAEMCPNRLLLLLNSVKGTGEICKR